VKNTKISRILSGIEHQVWAKIIATKIVESNNLTQIEEKALLFGIIEDALIDEPNLILKFINTSFIERDHFEVDKLMIRN
tara:strand:- start:127 stop:366 length:240 start_codon:yes stop_codon:yes gene_type:complete